jgi:CRISPR-associated protein Csm3
MNWRDNMHKFRINNMKLNISLEPVSPLLVKSGGISPNPLLPDMQFVRTKIENKETVYIPGSSLKGTFRSSIERTLRGIKTDWACDIQDDSCVKKLEKIKKESKDIESHVIYKKSCMACKMFGNTMLKGRVTIQDAYPVEEIETETRYGVSISRLSQAVAHGPFETEVAVSGTFETQILMENFEIWQLGGIALVINGLNTGIIRVGFGKNRGFGQVSLTIKDIEYSFMGSLENDTIGGAGVLMNDDERNKYGLNADDKITPIEPREFDSRLLETVRYYDSQQWDEIAQKSLEKLRGLK